MGKIGTFLVGMIVGGLTVYGSLHYHIVRGPDKLHFVPKIASTLSETYVDIRGFGFQDWNEHRVLAAAIAKAGKPELVQGVAVNSLENVIGDTLDAVGFPPPE